MTEMSLIGLYWPVLGIYDFPYSLSTPNESSFAEVRAFSARVTCCGASRDRALEFTQLHDCWRRSRQQRLRSGAPRVGVL
jgi:hypothetical protein